MFCPARQYDRRDQRATRACLGVVAQQFALVIEQLDERMRRRWLVQARVQLLRRGCRSHGRERGGWIGHATRTLAKRKNG
jgi:hypothetical protein